MTWEEIMRRVLPPAGGLSPRITGPGAFGAGVEQGRHPPSSIPHKGVDFNYPVGQTGINLTHPMLHSPVAGVVINAGEGNAGRIAIRDANGFIHEILHTHTRSVKKGDLVGVGTPIGTMGNTGVSSDPKKGDQHVHYQLKDRAGNVVNPTEFWNNLDPGKDDPGIDRYVKFGSVPRPDAPDAPANFSDRFGSWTSSPAGALGNTGTLAPQPTPNPGKRSDIPDNVTPTLAQTTPSAWPFLAANASGFGGVSKYAAPNGSEAGLPPPDPDAPGLPLSGSAGDDNVPERRLVGRVVNLSAPASSGAPPLVPNQAASTSPLLGLFSGQPMPDWPVPPPIFQTKDQSPPEDNELWQRWRAFIGD